MHQCMNFEILKFLFDNNINYVFIPKGLTSILQPLDVSINQPFKDAIRHQYETACSVFKSVDYQKVTREALLDWVIKVWENNETISPQIVKNSFKFCGISNNLDGSEDELFNGFDKLNEQGIIEQNFTIEDKDDENNIINIEVSDDSEMGSSDAELENQLHK